MIPFHSCLLAVFLGSIASLRAQTSWTNGGQDSSWNDSANWSPGLPAAQSAVTIAVQPTDGLIGLDTGAIANPIGSLTFGAALGEGIVLTNAGVEQLAPGAGVVNSSGFSQELALPLQLLSAQSIVPGAGLLFSGGVTLADAIALTGPGQLTLGAGTQVVVEIGASRYGHFTGSGALGLAGSSLVFDPEQTVAAGGSWDLLTGPSSTGALAGVGFSGAFYQGDLTETSPGEWQGIVGNLSWTYDESTGLLAAVPEPGPAWLVLLAGAMLTGRCRRGLAPRCAN